MAEQEKPAGVATDFGHLTPFEREKRDAMARQNVNPIDDGMREVEEEQRRLKKAREDHEKFVAAEKRKGAKVYHLLCSKGSDKKIRVVGMYSSTEELARGIAAGVTAYAAAGQILGTVELNLGLKVDQPPVEP